MTPRWLLLALLGASATFGAPASAAGYFISGNALLRHCMASLETQAGQASQMFCTAYVQGVVDSEAWFGPELKNVGKTSGVCAPERAEAGQAVEIVTAYLRGHPEERASNASTVVVAALFAAWPCRADR